MTLLINIASLTISREIYTHLSLCQSGVTLPADYLIV